MIGIVAKNIFKKYKGKEEIVLNNLSFELLEGEKIVWREGVTESLDKAVLSSYQAPFSPEGGVKLLTGNLGRAVIKVSAVASEHLVVTAPAVVLEDQNEIAARFEAGELNKDFVAVVRFQGPKANGMPELHKLTPFLGSLQDKGYKVALVTDGRMSGASGKVPAAIHLWPEAYEGGAIAKIEEGDMISVNALTGELSVAISDTQLKQRNAVDYKAKAPVTGMGRELFSPMRNQVNCAEQGASVF